MNEQTDYSIADIAELLCSGSAFNGMPSDQATSIAKMMSMRVCAKGEVLAKEGAPNAGLLMLVVAGEATIASRFSDEEQNLVYRHATPGHIIGEVGFIDGEPHSATCTAITDMDIAVLERENMGLLMQSNTLAAAQLMAGLLRLMAQRIRHANKNLLALGRAKRRLQQQNDELQTSSTRPQNLSSS
jgi:CRP/FNR family transcriptional regulator, cyclic AMP receptor protein